MIPLEPYKQPAFSLSVDGLDITTAVDKRLISLTLTDNRGFEADQLDISLDDSDGKLDLPQKGVEVRLSLGWKDSGLVDKGSYTVDEVSHSGAPDTLTIRARSADLRSGLTTQRERSFHQQTVGEIVNTIAAENDLQPMVSSALASQLVDHIDQTNESSANLLTRLAAQFDAIATVKGGRLLFIQSGGGVTASGQRLPTVVLTRQSGDSHHFTMAERDSYSQVKASYNDTHSATKGEVIWGKTEDDAEHNRPAPVVVIHTGTYKPLSGLSKSHAAAHKLARKTWRKMTTAQRAGYIGVKVSYNDRNLGVSGEVPYGLAEEQAEKTAAAKLAKKDAARLATPTVAIESSADNTKTLRHVYASQENARRAARAEWRRLQRGMAEFSITLAHGQPELIPETPATVQGFKPAIDSTDWIIIKVTHALSDSGYTTRLALEIKATEIAG